MTTMKMMISTFPANVAVSMAASSPLQFPECACQQTGVAV
jgi:hypothetical protein